MNRNLWTECKSYLSFRDLCATRAVCKEWMDIRSDPHPHLVYYFADGSFVDLPDSRDPAFRKCLLAANLTKLHCQIFGWDDLKFIIQLLPSLVELTFEIDGCEWDESTLEGWDGHVLSGGTKLKKLELIVTEFEPMFTIDFGALPCLNSFESNVKNKFENYDSRMMECLGITNTDWVEEISEIAKHTKLFRVEHRAGWTRDLSEFVVEWKKAPKLMPHIIQMHRGGMTFFHFSKLEQTLTAAPIFGVHGARQAAFMSVYRRAVRLAFELFPNHKINYHPDCDEGAKSTWLSIINPIRSSNGLLPLKVEEIPNSKRF